MSDEEILACLGEILAHLLDEPVQPLRPLQELRALPGWNDFVALHLLTVAESRFGVSFVPADTADLVDVGDLVALVARRMGRED